MTQVVRGACIGTCPHTRCELESHSGGGGRGAAYAKATAAKGLWLRLDRLDHDAYGSASW